MHTDSLICGAAAIALQSNASTILRDEATEIYCLNRDLAHKKHIKVSKSIGSKVWVSAEKAIVANVAAVRDLNATGFTMGYNEFRTKNNSGEHGHSDFYPVVIAATHNNS